MARGYEIERMVGLVARREELEEHGRANGEVLVRALDPAGDADESLWEEVVELQVDSRDERFREDVYRRFVGSRLSDLRVLFGAGRGAWYVALGGSGEEVWGSCGVVVSDGRGRFQAVDTLASHRREGVCSRLVVEAARRSGAAQLVICADPTTTPSGSTNRWASARGSGRRGSLGSRRRIASGPPRQGLPAAAGGSLAGRPGGPPRRAAARAHVRGIIRSGSGGRSGCRSPSARHSPAGRGRGISRSRGISRWSPW